MLSFLLDLMNTNNNTTDLLSQNEQNLGFQSLANLLDTDFFYKVLALGSLGSKPVLKVTRLLMSRGLLLLLLLLPSSQSS